jgi:hypothetical protein
MPHWLGWIMASHITSVCKAMESLGEMDVQGSLGRAGYGSNGMMRDG